MTLEQQLADIGLDPNDVSRIVTDALAEDLGPARRDVTSEAIFADIDTATADIVARKAGVIAGLPVAQAVFFEVSDGRGTFDNAIGEGVFVDAGTVLASLSGPVTALLKAERTMLNLLSRMSGVASHTHRWVEILAGTTTTILDTRKTTPGLRVLDKYAVRAGGGGNKRMGLFDVAMIKDNHKYAAGSITAAYNKIVAVFPQVEIQVEVDTLDEAMEAVNAGADFLLCDNMTPVQLRDVVTAVAGRAKLEATGTITLEKAHAYAETGVDYISAGALTHSSPILDIALDIRIGKPAMGSASKG